jgi:hypothetical protein
MPKMMKGSGRQEIDEITKGIISITEDDVDRIV